MSVALVYGRASADPSDQRISVDRQVKLGTARALDLWPDAEVRVFRDDAITAADPNVHRPGFAAFLAAVRAARKGEIAGVVVNEQSRLTRQGTGAWDELVVTLTKAGVTKGRDPARWPGVGRARQPARRTHPRRRRRRRGRAHQGPRPGCPPRPVHRGSPLGTCPVRLPLHPHLPGEPICSGRDDGRPHLEPDPVEAQVVADVFAWALEGHAMATIADRLNEAGAAPRSARWKFKDDRTVSGWKYNAVRALLTSPTVAGLRAHTDADGVLHTVPARWDALVDVDTWRRVQRLLGQPSTVTGSNGETYRVRTMPKAQPRRYLLSGGRRRGVAGQPGDVYGVLRCGKCGMPSVAQTQGRCGGVRVPAYQCHPKVGAEACGGVSISPADEIERLVVDAIQAELEANPKLRQRLTATQDADADAARWRAERDAAKARMLDAGARYGARVIDADTFEAMYNPAKADHDAAPAQLSAMTSDVELPSADDVIERWDDLTLAQQRGVVERLIERIDVAPGHKGHPGFNSDRVGVPVWRV